MNKIAAALIALALFFVSGACFADSPYVMPSAEKCKALPNMEAASCLGAVADALETVLKKYYDAARASIRKSAEAEQGIAALDLNEASASLEHAQFSWKAYRDDHCDMVAELYTTGSGKAVGESICVIEHTRSRIHELWEFGGFPRLPEPK